MPTNLQTVKALTFDLFGTVLDLGGSLIPFITEMLRAKNSGQDAAAFWEQWRARQRIEQYQDNIMMLGHGGYLETARRALVYTLKLNQIESPSEEVAEFMLAWQQLQPFADVLPALDRLKERYQLVALSNGDLWFLEHLAKNQIRWDFDAIFSVAAVGKFKPHPAVYRRAAHFIELEVGECLMVSANAFDVVGARSCGYRGAYVNRYDLPYDDSPLLPDTTVQNFAELADALL